MGNVYLLKDIINKGYNPLSYKLFTYSSHYRNKLNFTWEGMESSEKAFERLKNGYKLHLNGTYDVEDDVINGYEKRFHKAINDDLNMPLAMSIVWEVVRYQKKSPKLAKLLLKFDEVLGLKIDKDDNNIKEVKIPEEILKLVEERKVARENKNWEESDRLRDVINDKGYLIKDTKDGVEISKK